MDSFSYQDYILPYSTLKTSSQPFGHGIPEFSLTNPPILRHFIDGFLSNIELAILMHGHSLTSNEPKKIGYI